MPDKEFPVITLHQPYANLIAAGQKHYETRGWQPRSVPIGSIMMIHAAQANNKQIRLNEKYLRLQFPAEVDKARALFSGESLFTYPRGMIVCACRLVGVHRVEDIRDELSHQERGFGNYQDGRYAWELNVVRVAHPPVRMKGKQGIWRWETKLLAT